MVLTASDLALERFDYSPVGSEWAVLRLLTRMRTDVGLPAEPWLLVEFGVTSVDARLFRARLSRCERRLRSRSEGGDDRLWRGVFAMPLEVVEHPAATFALAGGETPSLVLPAPTLRPITVRQLQLSIARKSAPRPLTTAHLRRRAAALATTAALTGATTPAAALAATSHSAPGTAGMTTTEAATMKTVTAAAATTTNPATTTSTATTTPTTSTTPATTTSTTTVTSPVTTTTATTPTTPGTTTSTSTSTSKATLRHDAAVARRVAVAERHVAAVERRAAHRAAIAREHRVEAAAHRSQVLAAEAHRREVRDRREHERATRQARQHRQPRVTPTVPTVTELSPAPGFDGPTTWTGVVSSDPALTGAVRDLAGLLSNGNRPPSFLIPIYLQASRRYHVPWQVLAAINAIETDYGRDLSTSTAGAVGWMQFEPSTWKRYGVAADGVSEPNPYDPRDAIFAAAKYLEAAGAQSDIRTAVYAYNHAGWYVDEVMQRARAIAEHAQYERAAVSRRGTVSVMFATGLKRHPRVRFSGGSLSHYDRLIAAANMVSAANFPYLWGGGHEQPASFGPFDCSGSVSYVMQQAGYQVPTTVAANVGGWHLPSGPGRVTIFYDAVHTFMRIGNRYFGTSGFARPGGGAGWFDVSRLPASYLSEFHEVHVPHLGVDSFSPSAEALAILRQPTAGEREQADWRGLARTERRMLTRLGGHVITWSPLKHVPRWAARRAQTAQTTRTA